MFDLLHINALILLYLFWLTALHYVTINYRKRLLLLEDFNTKNYNGYEIKELKEKFNILLKTIDEKDYQRFLKLYEEYKFVKGAKKCR